MGARDAWYTSADWDEAAQALFETKLRRVRQPWNRWQNLRAKANALFFTGDPDKRVAAAWLLNQALEIPDIEAGWASATYERLGQYAEVAGDLSAAEQQYRHAIAACPIDQRLLVGRSHPEEDLARLLSRSGQPADERVAEELFDLVYEYRARNGQAWRPRLAELAPVDSLGEPYADPDDAAESIVVYHHTEPAMEVLYHPSRSALVALDGLLVGPRRPRSEYQEDFLRRFAVELGAYFGRVAVAETGGHWQVASPILDSRVTFDGRFVDPFLAGFKAVWYERPLVRLFDELFPRRS